MSGVAYNVFHTRPPHISSGSDKAKGRSQAVTGASSTAVAVGFASGADGGEYAIFVCDVPCHICFGTSSVGAATTSDMLLPANTMIRWQLSAKEETHFSVIREGASSGTLYWYLTG